MVISTPPSPLRTVSVDLSGLVLTTVPSQRTSFAAFIGASDFIVSCANIDIGKASTAMNNSVSSFLAILSSPFAGKLELQHETIARSTEKSKCLRSCLRNWLEYDCASTRLTARSCEVPGGGFTLASSSLPVLAHVTKQDCFSRVA